MRLSYGARCRRRMPIAPSTIAIGRIRARDFAEIAHRKVESVTDIPEINAFCVRTIRFGTSKFCAPRSLGPNAPMGLYHAPRLAQRLAGLYGVPQKSRSFSQPMPSMWPGMTASEACRRLQGNGRHGAGMGKCAQCNRYSTSTHKMPPPPPNGDVWSVTCVVLVTLSEKQGAHAEPKE